MAKFQMRPTIGRKTITARLGASDAVADRFTDKEMDKLVKLGGDSRYVLAATGDAIEGRVSSVDTATTDGYSTGAVQNFVGEDNMQVVVLDGAQATPGTGNVAVGDYVVVGTVVAKDTAQPDPGPMVCKATDQAAAKAGPFAWRVVAITKGAGAPGSYATIERVR